jgi:hypothetical protein
MSDTQQRTTKKTWQALVDWVHENGGTVHPNLELRALESDENHRGIFARSNITQGERLIYLPASLVLSGRNLPNTYSRNDKAADSSESKQMIAVSS